MAFDLNDFIKKNNFKIGNGKETKTILSEKVLEKKDYSGKELNNDEFDVKKFLQENKITKISRLKDGDK